MLVGKASITCPYEFLQHLGTTDALQTVDRMSEIDPNYGYFCILAKNFNLDFLDFKNAIEIFIENFDFFKKIAKFDKKISPCLPFAVHQLVKVLPPPPILAACCCGVEIFRLSINLQSTVA